MFCVASFYLDSDKIPPQFRRRYQSAPATTDRVKNQAARIAVQRYAAFEQGNRLLILVKVGTVIGVQYPALFAV